MTTGNHSGGVSPNTYSDIWSGGDGKYEIVGGKKRSKWNNYTRTTYYGSCSKDSTYGLYTMPVSAGIPTLTDIAASDGVKDDHKLVDSIRGHSFNGGVAFAESNKTVRLVIDTVGTVAGALLDVKRGNIANAARRLGVNYEPHRHLTTKDVAGRWLELQYGWLPLLSDVHEAAKMVAVDTGGPRSSQVRSSTQTIFQYDGSTAPSLWTGMGTCTITRSTIYEMQEIVPIARAMTQVNPAAIAWELVPYSFVIDWFIPIGTYLDNLAVIPTLSGRSLKTVVKECVVPSVRNIQKKNIYYKGCSSSFYYKKIVRVVGTGLNTTQPSFKTWDQASSGKHIANALALARNKLR